MFIIDKSAKFRNLPLHIKEHLTLPDPFNKNAHFIASTFLLIDLMIIVPLFVPFQWLYALLTMPFILFLNGWCIYLLTQNRYTIQLETVRYSAVLGAIGSYCYYILTLKYAYTILGMEGPVFLLATAIGLGLFMCYMIRYYKKKFASMDPLPVKRKVSSVSWSLAAQAPALGYIAYHFAARQSEMVLISFMTLIYYMFSLMLAYAGVKMTHKYRFIKANEHVAFYIKPGKKSKHRNIEVG